MREDVAFSNCPENFICKKKTLQKEVSATARCVIREGKETVEVMKLVPQERVQQPIVEHAPVPQFLQETVEVVLTSTERVQQRTVDVPVPQVLEETVQIGPT